MLGVKISSLPALQRTRSRTTKRWYAVIGGRGGYYRLFNGLTAYGAATHGMLGASVAAECHGFFEARTFEDYGQARAYVKEKMMVRSLRRERENLARPSPGVGRAASERNVRGERAHCRGAWRGGRGGPSRARRGRGASGSERWAQVQRGGRREHIQWEETRAKANERQSASRKTRGAAFGVTFSHEQAQALTIMRLSARRDAWPGVATGMIDGIDELHT